MHGDIEAPFPTYRNADICHSKRIEDAISLTPVFSQLPDVAKRKLTGKARLLLFDPDRIILRQGDHGSHLYVILSGRVEMVTYNNDGKEVQISFLGKNEFFGEMVFLTKEPRTVTIQTLEETLLCELDHDALREAILECPEIGKTLGSYYKQHQAILKQAIESKGIAERRTEPRFRIKVPVQLRFFPNDDLPDYLSKSFFSTESVSISNTGIRLLSKNSILANAFINAEILMHIQLPVPWDRIEIRGIIKRIVTFAAGDPHIFLGVKFNWDDEQPLMKIEAFLYG